MYQTIEVTSCYATNNFAVCHLSKINYLQFEDFQKSKIKTYNAGNVENLKDSRISKNYSHSLISLFLYIDTEITLSFFSLMAVSTFS